MRAVRWMVVGIVMAMGGVAAAEHGVALSVAAGPAHDFEGDGSTVGTAGILHVGYRWNSGFQAMATVVPLLDLPDADGPTHAFGAGARQSFDFGAYQPYVEASLVAADGAAALVGGGIAWELATDLHIGVFGNVLVRDGAPVVMEGLELVRQF